MVWIAAGEIVRLAIADDVGGVEQAVSSRKMDNNITPQSKKADLLKLFMVATNRR
jgi:hypothetical protein